MRIKIALLLLLASMGLRLPAQNDIENVIVETYYISNATDAVPNEEGGTLAEGSKTYRVFLDLCDSCALLSLFGSADHPMEIASTAPFYNNPDRGKTYGHEVNNGALDENTVSLDSWLSLGGASTQRFGVLKTEDPDTTSEELFPNDLGMISNADPDAGIPLTTADGLFLDTASTQPPGFFAFGISPDSAFNDTTQANSFSSDSTRITCQLPGVRGHGNGNKFLIAQLTTTGELTFCLNVEVVRADGTVLRYVSSDTLLAVDEVPSGLLCYPPVCGCTDPDFLEYDPTAGCDDGSCATAIIFGCLDPNACNYDPSANWNIPLLCCYGPDSCNGLDVSVVCPGVGSPELEPADDGISVFPNPVHDQLRIMISDALVDGAAGELLDRSGRSIHRFSLSGARGSGGMNIDLGDLASGIYLLRIVGPNVQDARLVVKD